MLAYLRAKAMSRGFLGGSQLWMAIGVVVWTLRFFQWLTRPETAVIYRDRLNPGQSVVITHREPLPSKRQRKRQAKQAKAQDKAAKSQERKARKAEAKTVRQAEKRGAKQAAAASAEGGA
jgi:hypothetical protein